MLSAPRRAPRHPISKRRWRSARSIDLKPFAANARKSIEAAIAEFRAAGDGVRVDAAVTDLRLVDIAFDATTLRVIAEADGTGEGLGDVAAEVA